MIHACDLHTNFNLFPSHFFTFGAAWYSRLKVRNYCVARLCPLISRHGSFLFPRETARAKPSRDGQSWYCFKTGITVLPLLARVIGERAGGKTKSAGCGAMEKGLAQRTDGEGPFMRQTDHGSETTCHGTPPCRTVPCCSGAPGSMKYRTRLARRRWRLRDRQFGIRQRRDCGC